MNSYLHVFLSTFSFIGLFIIIFFPKETYFGRCDLEVFKHKHGIARDIPVWVWGNEINIWIAARSECQ
jgi:hypothetical protein